MKMFAYLSQPVVEVRIIGLVLLSSALQAINTLDEIPFELREGINFIEDACVYIFAVEFFLRWWSAGRFKLKYLAKPSAAIDAVSRGILTNVMLFPIFISMCICVSGCCHLATIRERPVANI